MTVLIIVGLVMLVIGTAIGIVAGRTWASPGQQRDLEHQLNATKEELNNYQQDVAEHFMATSDHFTELTQSYRNLHEHLAKGALKLASTDSMRKLVAAGDQPLEQDKLDTSEIEAPKDWAPKVPGSHGMLSEEFGLKDKDHSQAEEQSPDKDQEQAKKNEQVKKTEEGEQPEEAGKAGEDSKQN